MHWNRDAGLHTLAAATLGKAPYTQCSHPPKQYGWVLHNDGAPPREAEHCKVYTADMTGGEGGRGDGLQLPFTFILSLSLSQCVCVCERERECVCVHLSYLSV